MSSVRAKKKKNEAIVSQHFNRSKSDGKGYKLKLLKGKERKMAQKNVAKKFPNCFLSEKKRKFLLCLLFDSSLSVYWFYFISFKFFFLSFSRIDKCMKHEDAMKLILIFIQLWLTVLSTSKPGKPRSQISHKEQSKNVNY